MWMNLLQSYKWEKNIVLEEMNVKMVYVDSGKINSYSIQAIKLENLWQDE